VASLPRLTDALREPLRSRSRLRSRLFIEAARRLDCPPITSSFIFGGDTDKSKSSITLLVVGPDAMAAGS
jgi:hypothetical protein